MIRVVAAFVLLLAVPAMAARKPAIFLSSPSASSFTANMGKVAKPNWQSLCRPPIPANFSSRAQTALNMGGLVADYHLAVQAEDAQQIKNIGKDISAMAKGLGVSESFIVRGQSFADFAERNEWDTLKKEIEAMRKDVAASLEQQHDNTLMAIIHLGEWIRTMEIVSTCAAENYAPAAAKLLYMQHEDIEVLFVSFMELELPPKMKEDPVVAKLLAQLDELPSRSRGGSFGSDKTLTVDDVKKIKEAASQMMKTITTKNGNGETHGHP